MSSGSPDPDDTEIAPMMMFTTPDRLPPRRKFGDSAEDLRALADFMATIEKLRGWIVTVCGIGLLSSSTASGLWTASSPLWTRPVWEEESRRQQAYNHGHGKCLLKGNRSGSIHPSRI